MRAVVCQEFAPIDQLVLEERPDPSPDPGQVVVAVQAAGVNFVDGLFVQGKYQIKPPLPFTPGGEVAGDVVAVGDGVDAVAVGDRVLAMPWLGGFASHVSLPAHSVVPIPGTLTYGQAAGLVQSYGTMLFSFTKRTHLEAGEWVLVLGAGGGIGLAAVDVATYLGARVIAAASSPDKLAAATAAGAEATIDYEQEDLKSRARELSGGGVDVVVDPVGDRFAEPALRAMRWMGRYLVIGFAGGEIPRVHAGHVLVKNMAVLGLQSSDYFGRDPEGLRATQEELLALCCDGAIRAEVAATHPLEQAANALLAFEQGQMRGKLVLTTGRA
jgi:NADPH2:quinone reductase